MRERTELPCGCVIIGKETRLCPAHTVIEARKSVDHGSPFWRRLDYSLSGLAILFIMIWFGGAAIVLLVEFIVRFAREFSFDLVRRAFYVLLIWAGAAATAVVLFVSVERLISHFRR